MEFKKKVGGGVGFIRKLPYEYDGKKYDADIKDGDIVKLADGGVDEDGQWGKQTNFKIETRNGIRKLSINQKTINVLVDEFGSNSDNWVGKDLKVIIKKDIINGKKCIIPFLVTEGWSLDEYGDLVKEGAAKEPKTAEDKSEFPEEDIDPADIPF